MRRLVKRARPRVEPASLELIAHDERRDAQAMVLAS
jgi:hypothetical protein